MLNVIWCKRPLYIAVANTSYKNTSYSFYETQSMIGIHIKQTEKEMIVMQNVSKTG